MTENEAIKILKKPCLCDYGLSHTVESCDISSCDKRDATRIAIQALEKQIPKKPYRISEIDDNDNAMVECPICHANSDYSINTIKSGFCWKCGQKLDWGYEHDGE